MAHALVRTERRLKTHRNNNLLNRKHIMKHSVKFGGIVMAIMCGQMFGQVFDASAQDERGSVRNSSASSASRSRVRQTEDVTRTAGLFNIFLTSRKSPTRSYRPSGYKPSYGTGYRTPYRSNYNSRNYKTPVYRSTPSYRNSPYTGRSSRPYSSIGVSSRYGNQRSPYQSQTRYYGR